MRVKENCKAGITAFLPVYNEEKRIEICLKCFQWCDEILLLDKKSTDSTVAIARKYTNVRILTKECAEAFDSDEIEIFMSNCKTEWCMIVTASDLIHPHLAFEIRKIINSSDFDFDIISVPYKPYFLGVCEKYSPWYTEYMKKVFRVSELVINLNSVHAVLVPLASATTFKIERTIPEVAYYHLTHQSADSIVERNIRYWKGEIKSKESLESINKIILKEVIKFIFFKRGLFKGKQAIALFYSYLVYYMMTYVFKWEYQYGKIDKEYQDIWKEVGRHWNEWNSDNH